MGKHVHNWQQIEKREPKLRSGSPVDVVDFITTPYIVTRKLLCTRCAELKILIEPDPIQQLFKLATPVEGSKT